MATDTAKSGSQKAHAIAYRQKRARILVHAQPNQSKNLYLVQMTHILTYQST